MKYVCPFHVHTIGWKSASCRPRYRHPISYFKERHFKLHFINRDNHLRAIYKRYPFIFFFIFNQKTLVKMTNI